MLTDAEIASIRSTVASAIGSASNIGFEVVLYRDGVALPPQSARLEYGTAGTIEDRYQGSIGANPRVLLIGAHDMDVRSGDRFTVDGVPYLVQSVRVVRLVQTIADVEGVQ